MTSWVAMKQYVFQDRNDGRDQYENVYLKEVRVSHEFRESQGRYP